MSETSFENDELRANVAQPSSHGSLWKSSQMRSAIENDELRPNVAQPSSRGLLWKSSQSRPAIENDELRANVAEPSSRGLLWKSSQSRSAISPKKSSLSGTKMPEESGSPKEGSRRSSLKSDKGGRRQSESSGAFIARKLMSDLMDVVHGEPSSQRIVKHILSGLMEDVYDEEADRQQMEAMPNIAVDKRLAFAFLKRPSPKDGQSMYDHLSALINKILAERPENVVEYFEEYSRNFKEERFRPLTDHLQDIYVPPDEYENTKKTMSFLQVSAKKEAEEMAPEEEEATETPLPNLMELQYHFQQAGIGFPPSEMLLISLAMHKLKQNQPITKMRFWGKIFGLTKNYNVVETEVTDEEYTRRNMEFEDKGEEEEEVKEEGGGEPATEPKPEPEEKVEGEEEENKEEGAGDAKFVPKAKIPETTFKPPPVVPREASGEGVNKKVFFVCNEPGEEWTPLPDVTPQQIDVSRKIKRFFTGFLDTEVVTYPPFPGTEANYLRAQIARISAGTQISPLGFYHFGEGDEEEEAEEEEAGEGKTEYVENPDFEPVPMQDLTDPSMSYWVHHTLAILKQGRTSFWNPKGKPEEEEEEAEEEEEETKEEAVEIETGPPLLTPLSEDASLETTPAWTVRQSTTLLPDTGVAIVRSNVWPGAYAFAVGKKFDNLYFGDGQKAVILNYSPPPLPPIENEYPLGPEIMEINDPTVEQEEEWRLAHEKKKPEPKGEEEEGGEEEEEEEGEGDEGDDEDEDDDNDE